MSGLFNVLLSLQIYKVPNQILPHGLVHQAMLSQSITTAQTLRGVGS